MGKYSRMRKVTSRTEITATNKGKQLDEGNTKKQPLVKRFEFKRSSHKTLVRTTTFS